MKLALSDVQEAQRRLKGRVHRTPILTSRTTDARTGFHVYFKCENLQRAGSFKIRGATNKLLTLTAEERQRGVVAFSSGNHAQGVALASKLLDVPATIVMPTDAPAIKVAATRGYGAEVIFYDREKEDREAIGRRLAEESGRTLVPPFDDEAIMAGQGTTALEFLEDVSELDVFLAPVGGGGLLSGCATAANGLRPGIRIFGVEPESANDAYLSFCRGEIVKIPVPPTIADGVRTQSLGEKTFPVLRQHLEGILLVSEDAIIEAVRWLLFRMKILVEPTGAVAAAAVLSGKLPVPAGSRVGVVLSGGNIDPGVLATLIHG